MADDWIARDATNKMNRTRGTSNKQQTPALQKEHKNAGIDDRNSRTGWNGRSVTVIMAEVRMTINSYCRGYNDVIDH